MKAKNIKSTDYALHSDPGTRAYHYSDVILGVMAYGISNHQPYDCLLNCIFRRRLKKTSKLRVTDLCAGNSSLTGEFPVQMASNAENLSI